VDGAVLDDPAEGVVGPEGLVAGRDDVDAGLEVESTALGVAVTTDDFIEGVTAFMGDGEPEFEGK